MTLAPIVDAIIETTVSSFDSNSSYFSPGSLRLFGKARHPKKATLGIDVSTWGGHPVVTTLWDASVALQTGMINVGDYVTSIGNSLEHGNDTMGVPIDDLIEQFAGPPDSSVTLQIWRPGLKSTKGITLTRATPRDVRRRLTVDVLRPERNSSDTAARAIAVITIPSLYLDLVARKSGGEQIATHSDLQDALEKLKVENLSGIVLDLRDNGGGHLEEASASAGLFMDNAPIARIRTLKETEELNSQSSSRYRGPIVVLVNRRTAAGAELLAAALRDNERAVVIGERSYGRGSIQQLFALDLYAAEARKPSWGQLSVTMGYMIRPTGAAIERFGVVPDIVLDSRENETKPLLPSIAPAATLQHDAALVGLIDTLKKQWDSGPSALPACESIKSQRRFDKASASAADDWVLCAAQVLSRISRMQQP